MNIGVGVEIREDLLKDIEACVDRSMKKVQGKGVFKGGGGGQKPPQNFQFLFLKSEGKEVERERERK